MRKTYYSCSEYILYELQSNVENSTLTVYRIYVFFFNFIIITIFKYNYIDFVFLFN